MKSLAALLATSTLCVSAFAGETPAGPASPATSALSSTRITVGLGAAYVPRYAGSDEYAVRPALNLNVVTPWGLYLGVGGLGYRHQFGDFFVSGAIGYDAGRKSKKEGFVSGSDKLRGMGDIKGSVLANLEFGVNIGKYGSLALGTIQPISNRERGGEFYARAGANLLDRPQDKVLLTSTAHFGTQKYNQTYFGVTSSQSANSGYAAYRPDGGLYAVDLVLTYTHAINKDWSVVTSAGATRYLQKASNSPIVMEKTNFSGMATVNYSF